MIHVGVFLVRRHLFLWYQAPKLSELIGYKVQKPKITKPPGEKTTDDQACARYVKLLKEQTWLQT